VNVKYFICGTPKDKEGVKFSFIGSSIYSKHPVMNVIEGKSDLVKNGPSSLVRNFNGVNYSVMVEYRPINPSDSEINRNAYIAVGALIDNGAELSDCYSCVETISLIHAKLTEIRDEKNRFPINFDFSKFSIPIDGRDIMRDLYIADCLCQASNAKDVYIKTDLLDGVFDKKFLEKIDKFPSYVKAKNPRISGGNKLPRSETTPGVEGPGPSQGGVSYPPKGGRKKVNPIQKPKRTSNSKLVIILVILTIFASLLIGFGLKMLFFKNANSNATEDITLPGSLKEDTSTSDYQKELEETDKRR